jgi:thiamine-monophosphate kinase
MRGTNPALRLKDLRERRIVYDLIVPRFGTGPDGVIGIGDDCAVLPAPGPDEVLVWTTDPCPTPVQCIVDGPDMSAYGRFTALINVSDLAAMGAKPLGLLVSTVMREDMLVAEYERFLDGLRDACQEWACPVLGGNIKDGPEFTANGTALGVVHKDLVLRRVGARAGDRICVIGEMGLFWAAVLARLRHVTGLRPADVAALERALKRPAPRLHEGQAVAQSRCATSCMDSSDGVIGCLWELAMVNHLDFVVDSNALRPHPAVEIVANIGDVDFRKLMLSWGDWNLVCTIRSEKCREVKACVESLGSQFADIGEVRSGNGQVLLAEKGHEGVMSNFASERFSPSSMFTHGLDAYIESLKSLPLVNHP